MLNLGDNWNFFEHAWLWDGAQRVGTVPCALKSVYTQAEFAHYSADLIVFTFVKLHVEPGVCILSVFYLNMVRTILTIIHYDAIT